MGNDVSFSASAWVDPSSCLSSSCAVLSQDASAVSAFTLGIQGVGSAGGVPCPCAVFEMPQEDQAGAAVNVAAAQLPSGSGWIQLTGVFNASHGALMLYVNGGDVNGSSGQSDDGNPAATTLNVSPWSAPGKGDFRIGGGPLSALVSDACVFYGVLPAIGTATQPGVAYLYNTTAPAAGAAPSGDGCALLHTAYP
jgi:hypothetical protein